jgi:hypothetical protein
MTTLELQNASPPYKFTSLGVYSERTRKYVESDIFPKGTECILTRGKFPFTDYTDMFEHSQKTHTLNDTVVKITAFTNNCQTGQINKYSKGKITVEGLGDGWKSIADEPEQT